MRKLSFLLALLIFAGMVFTSCSKDEEEQTPPTLEFLGGEFAPGQERVDGDVTLTVGEDFVFGITAKTNSDKNLNRVRIVRTYENISQPITVLDSTINSESFTIDIMTFAYPTQGMEDFECTVTDKNDLSKTISFTVTTVLGDPGINIFTGINLGSYNSQTNSSFGSITGETFSITAANGDPTIQEKIDWVYFHGNSFGQTLMSPANDDILTVYPGIGNWDAANRHSTLMGKTNLTLENYNSIENENQLILFIQNSGVSMTQNYFSELMSNPGGFAVNDVIAFETYMGKRGLILITAINPGTTNATSTITYNIKVVK
ncbi:MAG: hypothetical protein R2764_07475 [Bacteroidales bacterium]